MFPCDYNSWAIIKHFHVSWCSYVIIYTSSYLTFSCLTILSCCYIVEQLLNYFMSHDARMWFYGLTFFKYCHVSWCSNVIIYSSNYLTFSCLMMLQCDFIVEQLLNIFMSHDTPMWLNIPVIIKDFHVSWCFHVIIIVEQLFNISMSHDAPTWLLYGRAISKQFHVSQCSHVII